MLATYGWRSMVKLNKIGEYSCILSRFSSRRRRRRRRSKWNVVTIIGF
jgi:hypothetical protein